MLGDPQQVGVPTSGTRAGVVIFQFIHFCEFYKYFCVDKFIESPIQMNGLLLKLEFVVIFFYRQGLGLKRMRLCGIIRQKSRLAQESSRPQSYLLTQSIRQFSDYRLGGYLTNCSEIPAALLEIVWNG